MVNWSLGALPTLPAGANFGSNAFLSTNFNTTQGGQVGFNNNISTDTNELKSTSDISASFMRQGGQGGTNTNPDLNSVSWGSRGFQSKPIDPVYTSSNTDLTFTGNLAGNLSSSSFGGGIAGPSALTSGTESSVNGMLGPGSQMALNMSTDGLNWG